MSVVTSNIRCLVPAGDRCGEGPLWHPAEEALYWTDINRFLIHRYDVRTESTRFWFFEEPVTALALTEKDDTLAVLFGSGAALWKPHDSKIAARLFDLPGWPFVRLNDGSVDPTGALWAGSMRNNVNPDGSPGQAGGNDDKLFRIDPRGGATEWRSGLGISNTCAWSPDNRTFYTADTLANEIYAFDYDRESGAISNERLLRNELAPGLPDGSAVDETGHLWNCRYGGGCILRIAPDGSVSDQVEMPVTNITSCVFGGSDRKTLYVTTAGSDVPGERLAGGLFALTTAVAGLAPKRFKL